jgi:hypothetical protein
MGASTRVEVYGESLVQAAPAVQAGSNRLRRIDFTAGRALEILGHAIEYLTDEYVHRGGSLRANDGEVQAIQLLMALNRKIYYECPEVPTIAERLMSFLRSLVGAAKPD